MPETTPDTPSQRRVNPDARDLDLPPVPLFGPPALKAQLPNLLTSARVVMAALLVIAMSVLDPDRPDRAVLATALILFVLAALTDALDGYLARRWNAISVFGRVMDPFADKILILAGFVVLTTVPGSGVYAWMAVVMIARELLVTSIRGVCESRGVDFSASGAGKAKMIAQSLAVPLILLALLIDPRIDRDETVLMNHTIAFITTVITAWSAAPYITRALSALQDAPHR